MTPRIAAGRGRFLLRVSMSLAIAGASVFVAVGPAFATDPVLPSQCGLVPEGTPCANMLDGCHVGACKVPSGGGVPYCDPPANPNPCKNTDCAHGCIEDGLTGHICVPDGQSHDLAGHDCGDNNACTRNDVCDGAGHCAGTTIDCLAENNWDTECGTVTCNPTGGGCTISNKAPQGTPCYDGKDCTYNNGNLDVCNGQGQCGTNPTSFFRAKDTICWSSDNGNDTGGDDGKGHTWCKSGKCGDPNVTSEKGLCLNRTTNLAAGAQCGDYGNNCMNRHCASAGGACPAPTPGSECLTTGACANSPCGGAGCGAFGYTDPNYPCACSGVGNY